MPNGRPQSPCGKHEIPCRRTEKEKKKRKKGKRKKKKRRKEKRKKKKRRRKKREKKHTLGSHIRHSYKLINSPPSIQTPTHLYNPPIHPLCFKCSLQMMHFFRTLKASLCFHVLFWLMWLLCRGFERHQHLSQVVAIPFTHDRWRWYCLPHSSTRMKNRHDALFKPFNQWWVSPVVCDDELCGNMTICDAQADVQIWYICGSIIGCEFDGGVLVLKPVHEV